MNIITKIRSFVDNEELVKEFNMRICEECIHVEDPNDRIDVHIPKEGLVTHRRLCTGGTWPSLGYSEEFPCLRDGCTSEEYYYFGNPTNLEMEISEDGYDCFTNEDGCHDAQIFYHFETVEIKDEELEEMLMQCENIRKFLDATRLVKSAINE